MGREMLQEVRDAFDPEIASGGLRVVAEEYHPEAFGNASVVLAGEDFWLKLTRERGERYAFIAPAGGAQRWTRLQTGVGASSGEVGPAESGRPRTVQMGVQEAAMLVRRHSEELHRAFGREWRKTMRFVEEIEAKQREQMRSWHGSPEAIAELKALNALADLEESSPGDALDEARKQLGLAR